MGGAKQNYIITYATAQSAESIYLTFGNGKYAKKIFKAIGAYYEQAGYLKDLNEKEGCLILYKIDDQEQVIDDETLVFRFYQKQLIWQGQLPADLAILDSFIPEEPAAANA